VLERLAQGGLIKGKTIGVDSTTLEANAAMKSIVRHTGESYSGYLKRLAAAEGVEATDAAALRRMIESAKRRLPTKTGRARAMPKRRSRS
jgi:transposase